MRVAYLGDVESPVFRGKGYAMKVSVVRSIGTRALIPYRRLWLSLVDAMPLGA